MEVSYQDRVLMIYKYKELVNIMEQQEIWDKLAGWWNKYRNKPIPEVEEFLKNKKGKVLDDGCGSGRNLIAISGIEYYGVDFSKEMLKHAEENCKRSGAKAVFFKAEADELPFESNFFEGIVCTSTIHLIKEPERRRKALEEIYRTLKKGKDALISVWNKEENEDLKNIKGKESLVSWKLDGKNYKRYYYFYEKKEMEDILKKIGFKIIRNPEKTEKSWHANKNFIFYVKK
jgi:ubiquinone/menaquinone biosynthesis C-methylase UbiE